MSKYKIFILCVIGAIIWSGGIWLFQAVSKMAQGDYGWVIALCAVISIVVFFSGAFHFFIWYLYKNQVDN